MQSHIITIQVCVFHPRLWREVLFVSVCIAVMLYSDSTFMHLIYSIHENVDIVLKKYIILLFFIFCRKKLSNWFKIFISDLLTLKPTPQLHYSIQCSHNVQIPQWSWFTIFRNYLWFVLFDALLLAYCVIHETKDNKWYTVNEGISMLKFLIDNILSNSKGITVVIPTGTKCAPLLPVQSLHALRTLLKNVCTTN